MIRAIRDGWDRFWFGPIEVEAMHVLRVVFGIYMITLLISLTPNWHHYHALDGAFSLGDPTVQAKAQDWWSVMVWTAGIIPPEAFLAAMFAAAVAITLGWKTRAAMIVLFVLHVSAINNSYSVANGEDHVIRNILFCGCFVPWHATPWTHPRPERWAMRMLQVCIALLYVFTQANKIALEELWRDGTVMYLLAESNAWGRFPAPLPELFRHYWATAAASWGSFTVELGFPLLVWVPRLRVPMIVLLTLLHVTIAICIRGAVFFNIIMIVSMCAFLTDADVRWLRAKLGRPARTP